MQKQAIISIIIPIYNSEAYLSRCLTSLQKQTCADIEVLMIDDGSTDGSGEICRAYAEQDSRFRYVPQSNGGVSSARNHGLDLAVGKYIGFCDSDDWAEPDMYECLLRLIEEHESDVAIVSIVREHLPQNEISEPFLLNAEEAIREMHRGELYQGHPWNKLIRADLIRNHRFREDVAIFEDMLWMWETLHRANRIVFQNLPEYHYTVNPTSALRVSFRESYRTVQIACNEMVACMATHYPQNLAYAQRTLVLGNYTLADKLARAGRLTRAEYRALRKLFDEHYTPEVQRLSDRNFRVHMAVFALGRTPYRVYLSMKDVYRRLCGKG